jgi:PRTRC genetic system protein C
MSPQEVCQFYSASFGELTNAEVHDEGMSADGKHKYSFQRIAGTKG